MSYAYNDYVDCPALQDELENQFLNNPQTTPWPNGTLRLITSELNTNNTLQRAAAPGNGKLRTVQLVYQPRFTDDSSDSTATNCNGGTEYGDTSATYEIDPDVGKSRSWTITPADLAERCSEDSAWVAKQVRKHMTAIERNINQEAAAFVAAHLGEFYDSDITNVDVETLTTTNAYNTFLIGTVAYEWERIQWPGVPYLIGDGLLNQYMRATRAGCCALQGVDLGEFAMQNPMPFLRDPEIPVALGNANSFVAMGAGAVQMLTYLRYENTAMYPSNSALFQGVIVNPESGIAYDYRAEFDCDVWNFQLRLAYKFVTLPDDAYRIDDPLEGTNGILKFTIVNP